MHTEFRNRVLKLPSPEWDGPLVVDLVVVETYGWPWQWHRWGRAGWPWWCNQTPRHMTVSGLCPLFCWTTLFESTPATTKYTRTLIHRNTIYGQPAQLFHSVVQFQVIKCSRNLLLSRHVPTNSFLVRFQVLTAASIKMTVFWVVAPCSLV
jgi:hypothetical protein